MSYHVKQIIAIRRDLKMRRGKEIAQGSHASSQFMVNQLLHWCNKPAELILSEDEIHWMQHGYAKICVQINSEKELLDLHEQAKAAGLTSHIIQDSGHTEFNMVPTYTALAIGPHRCELLNPITRKLELY
jgi:PTH2 family peptidyl-tRNA hydrolase